MSIVEMEDGCCCCSRVEPWLLSNDICFLCVWFEEVKKRKDVWRVRGEGSPL